MLAGQVGFIGSSPPFRLLLLHTDLANPLWISPVCNMKAVEEATVGDTFHKVGETVEALPGFKPTKAMVSPSRFVLALEVAAST